MAPQRIVVATDFSPPARTAAETALAWAEAWGAETHLVHVWWSGLASTSLGHRAVAEDEVPLLENQLREWTRELNAPGAPPSLHVVEASDPAEALVQAARTHGADLIVVGAHGHRGLRRWTVGSVTAELARIAPVDVLCIHQRADAPDTPPRRFLVPVDFSEPSRRALQRAAELGGRKAELTLAHVREDFGQPGYFDLFDVKAARAANDEIGEGIAQRLEEWASGIREDVHSAETAVLEGRIEEEIVRAATEGRAEAIVISSHGRHGLEALFAGSVTQRTLQTSPLPVLVVPGPSRV